MTLALVRDLREHQRLMTEEEIADFETDLLAEFVLARASAGLVDSTIRNDTNHLELIRAWFGRPLWEMQPADADAYFGKVLRDARPATRTGRAGALSVFFEFLELRHKVELHGLTGRVIECPLDEMNRPRASTDPQLRVPPTEPEIDRLFAGWREELVSCRKFGPAARNYAVARLAADVGLRINEARMLDLDDVWGHFDADDARPGAPLFPSERKNGDGSCARATADVFRRSLAEATDAHLPAWSGKLTPHVLRHYCASQLYRSGMTLFAIQELLGHTWTGTTARYVHVHRSHVEEAWLRGHERATDRWKGLTS
ncbi:phage integrase family protein [Arthrobacter sp. 24S4-2]|uniref:tyrosine-type recombinase/integrase n=1 Tax=Arthrobacter sp. 24S4-2 TaxID=2575374 RepID=UPI0010C779EB|nr:tyrosine-type recombinase/integrase [Arthrobacter sp. 24S4-2]QCO98443.1 phage integrase family protein [Arthrobacter sp. 24S4-2]